jgi:hypothetical protein
MCEMILLLMIGGVVLIVFLSPILAAGSDEFLKQDQLPVPIKNFGPGPDFYRVPFDRDVVLGESSAEDDDDAW